MRAYLECGMLAYGFVRARCEVCGASRAVAFSCKKRGFCPSCCGRRMADTAARLVDDVLPRVPVHQWVLSFPYEMRCRLAWDGEWVSAVLAVFLRVVGRWYGRQAQALGHDRARWGSVTFVQRFGSPLNLNPGRRGAYGALVLCFARFFAACGNADRRPLTGGGSNACAAASMPTIFPWQILSTSPARTRIAPAGWGPYWLSIGSPCRQLHWI